MRSIVAFLFVAVISSAQNLPEIERLEKKIADHPDSVPDRTALLVNLTNRAPARPLEQVHEARRRNILWLIEHHPEANIYAEPSLLLPVRGRLADPAGSAEAVALWKEIAAQPGAKAEVIANAAIYLRALDVPSALALLDAHSNDPAISRARGLVDGAAVMGISGLGENVQFGSTAALRAKPEAKAAHLEIDNSTNPYLVGSAGLVFASAQGKIETRSDPKFESDEVLLLAERCLRRAMELAPPGEEWKTPLGQTLSALANRTLDPKGKVILLREADSLLTGPEVIARLAMAEFDAGDDAAAERDAERALAASQKAAVPYNLAQTTLGRIAAAKGDLNGAKTRLIASVTMLTALKNATFEPNMTLAQDVYDAGDRDAVVEFLEASRAVWKSDRGRIDRMISFVKKAPSADLVQLSHQFPGSEVIRHPAPAFEAEDLDGKRWTREQLSGKMVALEFGKALLAEKIAKDAGAVLLQVQDEDTKRRFEVLTNPTLVIIDRKGNVAAFRSGPVNETELRSDFESGLGSAANSAPKQLDWVGGGAKVTLAWEPLENAESYVVEWDSRDEKGWIFDRDKTVRVIPTRESSAMLDLTGFTRIRWRVYAVPKSGPAGSPSPWREIDGTPVTKNYK